MKIGFCMLLWTTSVNAEHQSLIEDLKATGYDGIEVPVFDGTPDDYANIGKMLDGMDLGRTAISIIPTLDKNPLSEDEADRQRGIDYLKWCIDCTAALGATRIGGPLHQTLGHFSGAGTTDEEYSRAREVHQTVGDYAERSGVTLALEAVNRFESYFATTMQELDSYVKSVDHAAIKSMYDTFHANLEEADPVGAYIAHKDNVVHVHISENDRGVPGRGHIPWTDTFTALKQGGYDEWLTIEAFGRALPDLAAATRVWRDLSESPEAVYKEGYRTIRDQWDSV